MQRILLFLRNHQIALAVLVFVMTAGVLFLRFGVPTNAPRVGTTALQSTGEHEVLLESGDAEVLFESSNVAATLEEQAPVAPTHVLETIVVYVTGAVRAPDVYMLPAEARVKDLVMAAGGLAADAASEHINLAEHLEDADHIHVPRLGEATNAVSSDVPRGTNVATEAEEEDTIVNINTASVAELDTLSGIGPAFAQRIVDYRMANGPFGTINDLSNVQGIGPVLLEKIAPKITTGTP